MEKQPFQQGDLVVYSGLICRIEAIGHQDFGAPDQRYYTLQPLSDNRSQIFVPCDNELLTAKLRFLLNADALAQALKDHLNSPTVWENDRKLRSAKFRDVLSRGNITELLSLIRCLLLTREEWNARGKKFPLSDSELLQSALRSVHSEFSFSLHLTLPEVPDYIRAQLGDKAVI